MIAPPSNAPTGMADQARTLAILMTLPSRWLGTIAWRRLVVLMLNRFPRPVARANSGTTTQNQGRSAYTKVRMPLTVSAPRATALNDQRRLNHPAERDITTTP